MENEQFKLKLNPQETKHKTMFQYGEGEDFGGSRCTNEINGYGFSSSVSGRRRRRMHLNFGFRFYPLVLQYLDVCCANSCYVDPCIMHVFC